MMNTLRRYFQHCYRKQSKAVVINFNSCDIDQTCGAGIKAVPAARIKGLIWIGRTKKSLISARAKTDLERAARERLRTRYYLFQLTRSCSHEYRASSVLRRGQKKGKTMSRKTWQRDLPGGTRTTRTDRRTNGRSSKKFSPLYQMEVYRDTDDFSRYQDIRQVSHKLKPEKEKEEEREENGLLFSSHARWPRSLSLARTRTFHDFLLSPPPRRLVLWRARGESERSPWMISRGLGPNGHVYVTVAIEEVVSLPMRKM